MTHDRPLVSRVALGGGNTLHANPIDSTRGTRLTCTDCPQKRAWSTEKNPYTEKKTHTQRMPQIWASGPQDAGVHRVGERAYTKDERQPTEGGGVHKKCARGCSRHNGGWGGHGEMLDIGGFLRSRRGSATRRALVCEFIGHFVGRRCRFPAPHFNYKVSL